MLHLKSYNTIITELSFQGIGNTWIKQKENELRTEHISQPYDEWEKSSYITYKYVQSQW